MFLAQNATEMPNSHSDFLIIHLQKRLRREAKFSIFGRNHLERSEGAKPVPHLGHTTPNSNIRPLTCNHAGCFQLMLQIPY